MKLLTKSRFKLGLECPNKLYYTGKPEYANTKEVDSFLASLAEGGFQVEELARIQYPDGIFIDAEHFEYEKAAHLTNDAFKNENATIYEAAFLVDGLFVRTDILVKAGNKLKLVEVKSKSNDFADENSFIGKRGGINSMWKPYLFDLAFQKYVLQKSFPEYKIEAFLLMADKSKKATVSGLNQMFRISKEGNPRTGIIKKFDSSEELGDSVLSEVNVDYIINDILQNKYIYRDNLEFEQSIELFKTACQEDNFLNWPTNFSCCKRCEFKTSVDDEKNGLKSGFKNCFSVLHNWSESDFSKPSAFEIWNYRGKAFDEENRLFLDELSESDFNLKPVAGKISSSERQWIQVEKSRDNENSFFVLDNELKDEMKSWVFPLHFIDFETSSVALPFHSGRKPYEQVAFQFSHHQYNENGTIEHKSEFICPDAGVFPNFNFAQALFSALGNDNGTIFRYAAHENTILNHIIDQLEGSNEKDKVELISFLKTITSSTRDRTNAWVGNRNMVDFRRVVLDYYYNPFAKGSNSIKFLLPAILNSSKYLKDKYSKQISKINLTSINFPGSHIWISFNGDKIVNPYKLLPPLFDNWSDDQMDENISGMSTIAEGGSALIAYSKLQYVDMSEAERKEITSALLKYCELDTLAMVMIYEHFRYDF